MISWLFVVCDDKIYVHYWSWFILHVTDHCSHYPFHQRESHQDLLLLPSLVPDCLPAKSLGNQTLFGLKLSSKSHFKLLQMMRWWMLSGVIALLSLASKLLLQMAKGSLLLIVTLDHLQLAEVAGGWYYNPSLRFLLSPLTIRMWIFFRSKLASSPSPSPSFNHVFSLLQLKLCLGVCTLLSFVLLS